MIIFGGASDIRQSPRQERQAPVRDVDAKALDDDGSDNEAEELSKKALQRTQQMQTALKVTADLWKRTADPWPQVSKHDVAGIWAPSGPRTSTARKKATMTCKEAKKEGFAHQCRAYTKFRKSDAQTWVNQLNNSDDKPTEQQRAFLDRVLDRCSIEHVELNKQRALAAGQKADLSEPVRDCLFGIPGAGKSHCIKLVRRFFEECLHWEDGVQFQFLAQQNTMASLIGGKTVNTWAVIPINPEAAARKQQSRSQDGDVDELFTNALGIRWLIIDECSTISVSLLAQLDAALRRACQRHPHAQVAVR